MPVRGAREEPLALFAIAAPGLEPLVAAELRTLGIDARVEDGGAAFTGGARELALANLWLRTASRVVARVGSFPARAFGELERRAKILPWERFLAPGADVHLRVTSKKSKLYHTGALAERIADAMDARLGGAGTVNAASPDDHDEETHGALVIARVHRDVVTLSVDASGALLHRRGYRLATAKAPMRETLAAALLLSSGYDGRGPLADPLCGAGTIAIEGAMLARRMAPGLARRFAFERWPAWNEPLLARLRDEARERALPRAPHAIIAADRDPGAIEATRANAARAGVAADIEARVAPLSALVVPDEPGWIVTNPPYGARVGDVRPLRDLYARLGDVARAAGPGWTLAYVATHPALDAQVGVPLETTVRTSNGGIPVRFVRGRIERES